jgi:restriction system protein
LLVGDRRKSEIESLLSLPWWVGVAAGVLAYVGMAVLLPAVLATEATHADLSAAMRPLGLLALGICLIFSASTVVRARLIRRQFALRNGLNSLRRLPPRNFEALVVDAFRRRGYTIIDAAAREVDLALEKDGRHYLVGYKRWEEFNVGMRPLRDLRALMDQQSAVGGFFISAGVFTRDARVFAAETNIDLIGGVALQSFLESDRTPAAARPYPEPVFLSSTAMTIPVCPSCGNPMVKRVAKFGKTAGEEFWGCGQFPHCRGTRGI